MVAYNSRNLFSQSSGSQSPKSRWQQGYNPSKTPGRTLPCLSQLLVRNAHQKYSWCSVASHSVISISASVFSWPSSLCVSLCILSSYKDPLIGFRAHPVQCAPISILIFIISAKTLSPNNVTVWGFSRNLGAILLNPLYPSEICEFALLKCTEEDS